MRIGKLLIASLAIVMLLVMCTGCAPGTARYDVSPAGFWAGLWHGLIMIITFIIGLFSDSVRMYEPNNVGSLYDLGFLIGAIISLGGFARGRRRKWRKKALREKEWEQIGERVEEKVRAGIQKWLDESEEDEGEWQEIARKVEEKIKRELSGWSDE
jgi:hypothetical protein